MAEQQLSTLTIGSGLNVTAGRNDQFWLDYQQGRWERDTELTFRRFLDPNHSYIDIGAWVGPTVLLAVGLAKRVYAIEPDPIAYKELAANISANAALAEKVELFNLCIAAEDGTKAFGSRGDGGDSTSSLLFSNEKTVWTVEGLRFETWVAQVHVENCNFIKIDIEGAEYSVLPTMAAYLNQHQPTLHLSLHPVFAGDQKAKGAVQKLLRALERLKLTIGVLKVLSAYRYLYDPRGKAPSGIDTFMSRVRDGLARITWKPAVLLLTCLYSMAGGNDTLVATNQRW